MVNVTELNRGPDISANAIYAASVSADSSTVGSLEAGGFNFIGEFETLSKFDTAAESGDRGYITEAQQFARQP